MSTNSARYTIAHEPGADRVVVFSCVTDAVKCGRYWP